MLWRQQKYNNSCMICALSSLLSTKGIDSDIEEITNQCHIPQMLEYNESDKAFLAGFLAYQNKSNYQNATSIYGFDFNEFKTDNLNEFLDKINELLENNEAMIISLASSELPYNKQNLNIKCAHAVLLYGKNAGNYLLLDSDAGLNRNEDYIYESVQDKVIIKLTEDELKTVLLKKNSEHFLLAYLIETDSPLKGLSKETIIRSSLSSLKALSALIHEKDNFTFETYEDFHTFTVKVIKPLVMDFASSLDAYLEIYATNEPAQSLKLILQDTKLQTFDYMKTFKEHNHNPKAITNYYQTTLLIIYNLLRDFLSVC